MTAVKDVMTKEVIVLTPETSVQDAMKRLVAARVGGAPVVNPNGEVVGVVSESDIVRLLKRQSEASRKLKSTKATSTDSMMRQVLEFFTVDWLWYLWDERSIRKVFQNLMESEALKNMNVGEIMTKEVKTVTPEEDMEKAAELMNSYDINRLPVVDADSRLVGIVARGDILKGLARTNRRKRHD